MNKTANVHRIVDVDVVHKLAMNGDIWRIPGAYHVRNIDLDLDLDLDREIKTSIGKSRPGSFSTATMTAASPGAISTPENFSNFLYQIY